MGCGRDINWKSDGGDCVRHEEFESRGYSLVESVLSNEVVDEGASSMVCMPEGHRGPKEHLESSGERGCFVFFLELNFIVLNQ